MKRTPAQTPYRDLVTAAEDAAIELLRGGYSRDVAALAESLRSRFLSGDFSGSEIETLKDSHGEPLRSERLRWDNLEDLCREHRRASPALGFLTFALASDEARAKASEGLNMAEGATVGSFCLAFDVRLYAIRHFGVPDDGTWTVVDEGAPPLERAVRPPQRRARKGTRRAPSAKRGGRP